MTGPASSLAAVLPAAPPAPTSARAPSAGTAPAAEANASDGGFAATLDRARLQSLPSKQDVTHPPHPPQNKAATAAAASAPRANDADDSSNPVTAAGDGADASRAGSDAAACVPLSAVPGFEPIGPATELAPLLPGWPAVAASLVSNAAPTLDAEGADRADRADRADGTDGTGGKGGKGGQEVAAAATTQAGREAGTARAITVLQSAPTRVAVDVAAPLAGDAAPRAPELPDTSDAAARGNDKPPPLSALATALSMMSAALREVMPPGTAGVEAKPAIVAAAVASAFEAHLAAAPGSAAFAPALATQVAWLVRDGVTQARLSLNPAEMGPVAVQIVLDGTQARVDFSAEIAATRSAIEASLPTLAAALQDSGLTLAGGGVFDGRPRQGAAHGHANAHAHAHAQAQAHAQGQSSTAGAGLASAGPAPRATRGLVDLVA